MDETTTERRERGRGFRREHPMFFWGTVLLAMLFLGGTAAVATRIPRYQREAAEINAQMTSAQRTTRD
ncbi:MAG TPA: hypothetical protein VFQ39_03430, partial [Longimicrobium sp.]|nr:hypothetical protein [Longimicrobium sp.]